jgi:hypothetical protein
MHAERFVAVSLALVCAFLVVACGASFKLTVSNDTDRVWFVRAPFGEHYPDLIQVHRIEPGASGIALSWDGDLDFDIELLNSDCQYVGNFESTDGTTYAVEGVAGLTGTIDRWSIADRNSPGISTVTECGGSVSL